MSPPPTPPPDRLDRMLTAADPAPAGVYCNGGIADALHAIGETIVGLPRREARPSRRRRLPRPRTAIVVAAVVASLAGGSALATRLFVPTYTHRYPPKWAIIGAGPGQILNIHGTDFRQIAARLASDIPYPSGFASWRAFVVPMETTDNWRIPAGQLHGEFAMSAICAWIIDWRHATLTGDRSRAAQDAAVLGGALRWPAVTAWDPHPKVSEPGDGGTHHPSTFGWAIPYIQAVQAGDLARLDRLLKDEQYNGTFHVVDPAAWDIRTRIHFGVPGRLAYPSWLDHW
jgi:hypothetical protein